MVLLFLQFEAQLDVQPQIQTPATLAYAIHSGCRARTRLYT
jgi:hypothetical protein